jgi:hypothetical protein
MENMKTLTVHCYAEDPTQERRVTMRLALITVIAAATEDTVISGKPRRIVTVMFMDGASLDVVLDHSDLTMLEEAIGSYCFE